MKILIALCIFALSGCAPVLLYKPLGFIASPATSQEAVERMQQMAKTLKEEGCKEAVATFRSGKLMVACYKWVE